MARCGARAGVVAASVELQRDALRCGIACLEPSRRSRSCRSSKRCQVLPAAIARATAAASRSAMVGRLVEQRQQVRTAASARAPGSGRRTRQPPENPTPPCDASQGRKPKAVQQASRTRFGIVAVDLGEFLVRGSVPSQSPRQRWRPSRPRGSIALQLVASVKSIAASAATAFLRDAGGRSFVRQVDVALVRLDLAHI